jgi:aspartate-semialdehyde dehydrogenase
MSRDVKISVSEDDATPARQAAKVDPMAAMLDELGIPAEAPEAAGNAPAAGDAEATEYAAGTRPLHVGVVGATGNVGAMLLRVLVEREVPIASVSALASARSAGKQVRCGALEGEVELLDDADPTGLDVALFSAGGSTAELHAPRFAAAGVVVIDNSSAFRMDADVPLVVPEVNPLDTLLQRGIVANPNCSTIQLVAALKPIADEVGLEHVQVTTFQAVSGTGHAAIERLHSEAVDVLEARELEGESPYPHQIAFNVLPQCDVFGSDGSTREERKLVRETRKILGDPNLPIGATCVRVPVFNAHSEAVHLRTIQPISPEEVRELLAAAPGVRVVDDPAAGEYPMPVLASGIDEVLVGRIRHDPSVENGIAMFVVADNLRKGAATNAVQILELMHEEGLFDELRRQP